jgi:hypothetical protein
VSVLIFQFTKFYSSFFSSLNSAPTHNKVIKKLSEMATTSNPIPLPPITLSPALPEDCYDIAALEARTFYDEPFSAVAFGPKRDFSENITRRAKSLASEPKEKGSWNRVVKAVINVDGKEEIVGAAGWTFVTERNEKEDGGNKGDAPIDWGEGANVKFCEDMFLVADGHMLRSTEGKDYASRFPSALLVPGSTNGNRVEHTGGIAEVAEKRDREDVDGEWIERGG